MVRIDHILTGPVAPLGPRGAPSGIDKRPVAGRLWLGREGFAGDGQGDRKRHGGPDKAVHHYAFDHYPAWRAEVGGEGSDVLAGPGAFGENVSTAGLVEAGVAVGDTFRAGGALIQVSQGRQPCWKLDLRFGVPGMAARVQATGRTGWYCRVLEPGFVEAGDALELLDRPSPEWTVERLWRALYVGTLDARELAAMAGLAHLPEGWRGLAAKRLATGRVEDWSRRLAGGEGPAAAGAAPWTRDRTREPRE